jgi:hypothetical protein
MKTKIFKSGLPFMVFMMAIAFAFASEKKTDINESLAVQGYVQKNGACQLSILCDDTGGPACQDADGFIVHRVNNGTFCSIPMSQWR